MAVVKKLYVHIKANGDRAYYKGIGLEFEDPDVVKVLGKGGFDELAALIILNKGESVGEYFNEGEKE